MYVCMYVCMYIPACHSPVPKKKKTMVLVFYVSLPPAILSGMGNQRLIINSSGIARMKACYTVHLEYNQLNLCEREDKAYSGGVSML